MKQYTLLNHISELILQRKIKSKNQIRHCLWNNINYAEICINSDIRNISNQYLCASRCCDSAYCCCFLPSYMIEFTRLLPSSRIFTSIITISKLWMNRVSVPNNLWEYLNCNSADGWSLIALPSTNLFHSYISPCVKLVPDQFLFVVYINGIIKINVTEQEAAGFWFH